MEKFLDSVYWDIREASILSLSEIGNRQTLKLLRSYVPRNTSDSVALKEAIPFLESRLEHTHSVIPKDPVSELFHKAEELFENDDYGKARLLLESLLSSMGRSHNLYSKTLLLLARSCGEMGKTNKAIELIIPEFRDLPIGMREGIADDLTNWLWSELVFENYDPSNDQLYIYAINLQLDLALKSTSPDDVLSNIRSLTRWMEIIGNDDIAQWIRALIRTEAPGTLYVDKDDRSRYVRDVEISEELRLALSDFQNRLKDEVPIKLRQVLGGGKDLQRKKSKLYLLGD